MHQELPTINGELLRLRRETRGWALSDLATRACMSIKQIRQLEEGGSSAFYSDTIKWTSAKKVGSLLGMQPEEVFVQVAPAVVSTPPVDAADVATNEATAAVDSVAAPASAESDHARQDDLVDVATDASVEATASLETSHVTKTPVLALAALFVAALAVAAWMRPEPEVVTEPAPPVLQNMATEPGDATSAPSVTPAQKPASTTLVGTAAAPASATASVAAASASVPRAVTPAASAASAAVVKPANAVQAPAAAASVASKPL